MNVTMKNKCIALAQKLRANCPDNDCKVFLNVYGMLEGVSADLKGCLLSEWSRKVLEHEQKKLEFELENMYLTNYAIRQYRRGGKTA